MVLRASRTRGVRLSFEVSLAVRLFEAARVAWRRRVPKRRGRAAAGGRLWFLLMVSLLPLLVVIVVGFDFLLFVCLACGGDGVVVRLERQSYSMLACTVSEACR